MNPWGGGSKFCKADEWNSSLGSPMGIRVIPEGICPDGYSRIVTLQAVQSNDNGDTKPLSLSATSFSTLYASQNLPSTENPKINGAWAISATASSSLNVLDYDLKWITVPTGTTGTNSFPGFYLPIDHATKYVENPYDTGTTWSSYPTSVLYSMSPYLSDGRLNPMYFKDNGGQKSIFSDFDGSNNTNRMIEAALDGNPTPINAMAAYAAIMYSSNGGMRVNATTYLPAIGEIGFLLPRLNIIENSFKKIFGSTFFISNHLYIWSSTEYGGTYNGSLVPYSAYLGSNYSNILTSAAPKVVWPFAVVRVA